MKKIITLGLSVFFILFSITSYAGVDGKAILKNWYDLAFQEAVVEMVDPLMEGRNEINNVVSIKSHELAEEADSEIMEFASLLSKKKNEGISNYQNYYIGTVHSTEESLKEKDFSDLSYEESMKIENELEEDIEDILSELLQ